MRHAPHHFQARWSFQLRCPVDAPFAPGVTRLVPQTSCHRAVQRHQQAVGRFHGRGALLPLSGPSWLSVCRNQPGRGSRGTASVPSNSKQLRLIDKYDHLAGRKGISLIIKCSTIRTPNNATNVSNGGASNDAHEDAIDG